MLSFPAPPLITSTPAAPTIVKPSDCEDKLRSVPELFNVTDSILLIFALSLKICVPAESTNESVPAPPFKVSELASPEAATANVSTQNLQLKYLFLLHQLN